MKINFSSVIFTDIPRVTYDGSDGLFKRWIVSNSDISVVKIRQQGGGSEMICAGIVDQTVIGLFKVDKGVKLKSTSRNIAVSK